MLLVLFFPLLSFSVAMFQRKFVGLLLRNNLEIINLAIRICWLGNTVKMSSNYSKGPHCAIELTTEYFYTLFLSDMNVPLYTADIFNYQHSVFNFIP